MNQLIPFNPTAGGKTPNFCLANVCAGFGIPNKYGSAWEAWEHTEQHTDPIPSGLAVPVFFSYTATIDGVNQNWGHIGVRLKSGQFWSDGNIYDSIDAYLVNHWPKYVGWGESINDVKVIGEEDMAQIQELEQMANDRQALLDRVGGAVSVPAPIDGNSIEQVLANIHQLYTLVDEKDKQIAELQKTPEKTPTPPPSALPETPPAPARPRWVQWNWLYRLLRKFGWVE